MTSSATTPRRVALVTGGTDEIGGGLDAARPRQAARGRITSINQWGTPKDIGRAVTTLVAGDLPFTTGAAILVDGGMHIHCY